MLVNRVGQRVLIFAGQVSLAAGILWIGLAVSADVTYRELIVAFALAGIGMGLTFAPTSTLTLASVGAAQRGVASGTNNTIREFGVAAGVAVLSSVFSTFGGFAGGQDFVDGLAPAVLAGAAVIAAGAAVALCLLRKLCHQELCRPKLRRSK